MNIPIPEPIAPAANIVGSVGWGAPPFYALSSFLQNYFFIIFNYSSIFIEKLTINFDSPL